MGDSKHQLLGTKPCGCHQANQGQGLLEYGVLLVLVAAAALLALAAMGTDVRDVFSQIVQSTDSTVVENKKDLPPGMIEVVVLDEKGQGIGSTWVYAFDGNGNWIGLYQRTNEEGIARFENMADGAYQFLAYHSPHYYWSNIITYPNQNTATIKIHQQQFTVKVVDEEGKGIGGVYVYAYTANERYWLGVYGRTANDGQATVNLPDGDYKFRAYYRGLWHWSTAVNSPAVSSTIITVQEQEMTVTVVDNNGDGVKASNLYVYGYTENGAYSGVYGRTNGNGRVKLTVPAGNFKFRVYYRGSNYWSGVVNTTAVDSAVIKTGERPFTVNIVDRNGNPVKNLRVYAYTSANQYVGLNGKTNQQGQVIVDIPDGNYKFRADYRGSSFWSSVISSPPDTSTSVTVTE